MSPRPSRLPPELASLFSVSNGAESGLTRRRMRAQDLEAPRRGVRRNLGDSSTIAEELSAFELAKADELRRIQEVTVASVESQFFSHRSAALLWGAPVPHRLGAPIHLSVLRPLRAPRALDVVGHGLDRARCGVTELAGVRLTDPATTWAHLGEFSLPDLVAAGDYFVRRYREGYGRRNVGQPPLATLDELLKVCELGRWPGVAKLRCALGLIREDSWSPQESFLRLDLLRAGLPEPALNADIYDQFGVFLACIDLAYEEYRVGVEYQSAMHHHRYAADVERLAALRDEQWDMIEVTSALNGRPGVVADRVRRALRKRGWPGPPQIPGRVR